MANRDLSKLNPQWWLLSKNEVAPKIFDIASKLFMDQTTRRERNIRAARLYGNTDFLNGPYQISRSIMPQLPEDRVKLNIISSMSDTVTSKIGKNKPKVTFLTEGANFQLGEEAQKLSKFVLGAFMGADVYQLHQMGFRDSTVFDIGALKHYLDVENKKIVTERVLATELLVDEIDGMYGKPACMYQIKFLHRDVVKTYYPKKAGSIATATGTFDNIMRSSDDIGDYIIVLEAWHLPTTPSSGDGRHIICLNNDTLVDEEYAKDYHPFTFFRWTDRLTGFWGQSLADRLTGTQLEINKLLRFVQKSFHLGSAFKVFLEHGSRVAKEHLNNEIGSIIYYTGAKPEFFAPKVVNDQVFNHINFLVKSAYEEAGISQLSATSRKPAGIDSGKALREYNDIETERFAIVAQRYEQSFLDTAFQYIDLAKEAKEQGVDLATTSESKKFIQKINWSDVDIEHDQYIMQMFPTSMLPHTPAGRMAYVQELVNEGFVPREFALKLLDFPDLESYTSIANAPMDDLLNTLDELLKGQYSPPEPFQDLQNGVKLFQAAYLKARREKVPESRLELIRRWITNATALLQPPQQPVPGTNSAIPVGPAVAAPVATNPGQMNPGVSLSGPAPMMAPVPTVA